MKALDGINSRRIDKAISYTGLCLIGMVSLGFMLYYRSFAKLHIYLSFIKAPFFIGDMVFAACLFLFLMKWRINPKSPSNITWVFLVYFTFVTLKSMFGYCLWGPLALRHSVMFFYPLLGAFAYSFYRPDFFSSYRRIAVILLFIFIFKFLYFHPYYNFTCFILIAILIKKGRALAGKLALSVLLLLLLPYKVFFNTSRSFMTGNVLASTYILCCVLSIYRVKRIYKVIIAVFFLLFIVYGLLTMSSRSDLRSLIGFDVLSERFNMLDRTIRINEKNFVEPKPKLRLYNEKRDTFTQIKIEAEERKKLQVSLQTPASGADKQVNARPAPKAQAQVLYEAKINRPVAGDIGAEQRDINVSYANTLFRVFIWRDAFAELISKAPVFGFDFGRPFRSHALEVLGWAKSEWMVDGWICMHNSYIDLVYRAGVVGLLMIVVIIALLLRFTVVSLRSRSLTGILLTGVLINWLIAANFIEILEMPYSAIPLWSLFGLTFAYLFKNKTA